MERELPNEFYDEPDSEYPTITSPEEMNKMPSSEVEKLKLIQMKSIEMSSQNKTNLSRKKLNKLDS